MSEWKLIESAPKDGRDILLLTKAYDDVPAKCAIGSWNPEGDSWIGDFIVSTGFWSSGTGWFQPDEISHWMPLPDVPK